MIFFQHHVHSFAAKTHYLSHVERSVLVMARDHYISHEAALDGNDFDLLARRLRCHTPEETHALQFVLREFFEQDDEGQWRSQEFDEIIAGFSVRQNEKQKSQSAEARRKALQRQRRSTMFAALARVGVVPPALTPMAALRALCAEHQIKITDLADPALPAPPVAQTPIEMPNEGVTLRDTSRDSHGTGTSIYNHNHKLIPPNPPGGGREFEVNAFAASQTASSQPEPEQKQPVDQCAGSLGGQPEVEVAQALLGCFPAHRRTRVADVTDTLKKLLDAGEVTGHEVIASARAQRSVFHHADGRACPNVLSWLRRKGWHDAPAAIQPPPAQSQQPQQSQQSQQSQARPAATAPALAPQIHVTYKKMEDGKDWARGHIARYAAGHPVSFAALNMSKDVLPEAFREAKAAREALLAARKQGQGSSSTTREILSHI